MSALSATRPVVAHTRRGACPALSAPMATGDGLLVRLSLAEGGMTAEQVAALCELALRHGNGIVEVTARGSFQIRGLRPVSAPLLEADVAALGLPLREGVPVETSPLAGLDGNELANPLPLVRAIRAAISNAGLAERLGPKVSVVVDCGGSVDLSDILADVRLTAIRQDDAVLWRLSVSGNSRTARPVTVLDAPDAAAAVVMVLEAIAAEGISARGRDVPDIDLAALALNFAKPRSFPVIDSARRHPAILERLPLADTRVALTVALPFGSTEAAKLAPFAMTAAGHGITDVRLAPARSLILLCPDETAATTMADEARECGLITDLADPRRAIAACPGAPACASAHIATREIALRLAEMPGLTGSTHVSGCAKGCAHPSPARLTLTGTATGIALIPNGRASDTAATIFADADAALTALLEPAK